MNAFRLKKQLWRRWRRWKKALWVGTACAALTILAWGGMRVPEEISGLLTHSTLTLTNTVNSLRSSIQDQVNSSDEPAAAVWNAQEDGKEDNSVTLQNEQLLKIIAQSGISRTVHLKIDYVSGEEIQTLPGVKDPVQLKVLITEHQAWKGWLNTEGDLWLEKKVDDLSPSCKKDSYIGIDEHGNLTLFKGHPVKEEVLKTFFQMDMGSMKSSLPENIWKQLQDGIRVQDIEEYNSVLSTFSDYARDSAEQVMQSKD
ncbi:BofC C-terminal domain-containing protein [Paenibacillus wynnii]|uniref:BofC C-terminal domain-containing protein n=1 Tax=Paenibacillus wynnii TaxID=268407 RepID=UPI00278C97A4|nr:BofC C-terminal domain-containing protein [Paenibacillus wynnii]MDQ0192737.1 forespore regulator of the sigma-K checkpoint [Paenibacillus wynnii]